MQTETRTGGTLVAGESAAIEFDGLSKSYHAGVLALDSLTLTVPRGEIFGFLGPNGAGKTTTIRTMLDLIRPTSGSVRIFGENCNDGSAAVRGRVGYLPGDLSVYPNLTGRDVVDLFASLRPGGVREEWVRELAARLSLDLNAKSRELSHGNKQKVGIVLALMVEPELIILDEPTSGLDPLAQRTVLEILREVNERGATVFFSSHNLPEVQRICDRVGMIREGKLIAVKQIEEVVSQRMTAISVTFDSPPAADAFATLDGVRETGRNDDGKQITLEAVGEVDALVKAIAAHHVLSIESVQPTLEEEFLALYERGESSEEGGDA
ncbi:MAG: ABC transporter ATP-binding protein [Chloroflexi bacterium]|nr:ABC transporter ATP-binding protein [Chloroflexota bacterium]